MRMLTEAEREAMERWRRSEWVHVHVPLPVAERLIALGRAEIGPPAGEFEWTMRATEAGERALRIDALIRQWGFGS